MATRQQKLQDLREEWYAEYLEHLPKEKKTLEAQYKIPDEDIQYAIVKKHITSQWWWQAYKKRKAKILRNN
jgi:hypothetical protein